MIFWSRVTSYFITSSENNISNFDIVQLVYSTVVIKFRLVNGRQTSITDLRKPSIMIWHASIEKYRHQYSSDFIVNF